MNAKLKVWFFLFYIKSDFIWKLLGDCFSFSFFTWCVLSSALFKEGIYSILKVNYLKLWINTNENCHQLFHIFFTLTEFLIDWIHLQTSNEPMVTRNWCKWWSQLNSWSHNKAFSKKNTSSYGSWNSVSFMANLVFWSWSTMSNVQVSWRD